MIKRSSELIVQWQLNKKIIPCKDKDLYLYAYETLLGQLINFIIAGIIAFALDSPLPVLFFLASYIPLRTFAGGYHAKTNERCVAVSALILIFVCHINQIFPWNFIPFFLFLSGISSGTVIYRLSPVAHANNPLESVELQICRKRSQIIWGVEYAICILLYLSGFTQLSLVIALSHIILTCFLILGFLKLQKEQIRNQ